VRLFLKGFQLGFFVKQSRYSIAFFCHPNDDIEIACLETCQREHPPIYPPILAGEYLLSRLQAIY
jgi:isopenicillin N synthase-like dioxygenase